MQSLTTLPPTQRSRWDLMLRALRVVTRRETPEPSRFARWADIGPVDFEGEDTSLTQEELALLK